MILSNQLHTAIGIFYYLFSVKSTCVHVSGPNFSFIVSQRRQAKCRIDTGFTCCPKNINSFQSCSKHNVTETGLRQSLTSDLQLVSLLLYLAVTLTFSFDLFASSCFLFCFAHCVYQLKVS